jgi:hypothetical protein
MWEIISINWTAQAVSGEQMLALRDAACKYLKGRQKGASFDFKHETCEGRITRGKQAAVGTFAGTVFTADLGTVNGERWTIEFLIPRGTERYVITDDSVVIMTSYAKTDVGIEAKSSVIRDGSKKSSASGSTAVH